MPRRLLIPALALVALLLLAAPTRADWTWPVSGEVITPYRFGGDPYAAGQHRGIDIAAPDGAPVVAAASGEVRFAGMVGSSGLTISIRTADGRYDTSYLHLSSASVSEGEQVAAGQRVGAVGRSGERAAELPHLHFGVRDAGTEHGYHDPLGFLPPAADAPNGPRGAPAPHAVPVTAGPGRAPGGAPAPGRAPAPHGAPVPGRAPAPVPAPDPVHAPAPHGAPAPGRAPAPVAAPRPIADPAAAPALPAWAIACAALLGAAALGLVACGRTANGRTATHAARTPRRRRIAALLKPRLGTR